MVKNTLFLLIVLITGCGPNPEETKQINAKNFNTPEFVGELKGNRLYRVEIARANMPSDYNHFIYFFDNNPVVTINRAENSGKTIRQKVEVFIDGKSVMSTNIAQ